MLQRTITIAAKEGIKNIQIGMAHRGRLNVLTHVLEKPVRNDDFRIYAYRSNEILT